jgi:ATP phosphoribosyltransferase
MSGDRLKLAMQKSGRLADDSKKLLEQCGISFVKSKDQLYCRAQNFPLDVYFVRDDDIPAFVASKVCQVGIVGQNVLFEEQNSIHAESMKDVTSIFDLGFGRCRLSIAVPHDFAWSGLKSLEGKSIATSYEGVLSAHLKKAGIGARIVKMQGSVEIAPRIHMADVVCDLVSTGSTLAMNGLKETEVVLESQAVLIRNASLSAVQEELLARLLMRIKGVSSATASKYIMLHAPVAALEAVKSVLPGSESPTILKLQGRDDIVALHVVCNEGVFWDTMEILKSKGASSILVLPIEKMLE